MVVIAAFVEAYYDLSLYTVADGQLTFTAIALSFLLAFDKLVQPQLL